MRVLVAGGKGFIGALGWPAFLAILVIFYLMLAPLWSI
jgi:hypothetical protein